jgi:chromosome segregation ATPase
MESIQAEINAIQSQIKALKQERQQLTMKQVLPETNSPADIAQAYRRQAREAPEQFAEIKGIDDAIVALETQLSQKRRQLQQWQRQTPIQQQVEQSRQQAQVHAQRINQLAAELAAEVKALKAIADDISPSYWQVYYKPFITGFKDISVPHVRSDGDVWTIVNRLV